MKFRAYVIFFLLFGVLADLYICLSFLPWWGKLLVCLPSLAALVCLVQIGAGIRYTPSVTLFSYLIFLFELPKFVFMLFSAPGLPWVGLAAGIGVSLFFAVLIFYTTRHLKVNELELAFQDLPDPFNGLRICQLADLHLGSFGKRARYIGRIVDAVLAQRPDLILFTGDLVNFEASEAEPYRDDLARLQAPLGVFAIRGNHDYLMHGHHDDQARRQDMARLLAFEKGLGWRVLLNEHAILEKDGARMALVGVENVSANPYFKEMGGDLRKALEGIKEGIFTILLSHDPSHWRREVVPAGGIPLTLSGHTHGLRYKLAGLRPSHWKLPESGGVYEEKGQVLHVSRGLGSAFAFRLGGFPNVDSIRLIAKT